MKIVAFGDSFTNGFNERTAKHIKDYIDYKGYVPKSYIDLMGDHFNCRVENFATQGSCNQQIFNSFITNFHKIEKGDVVIINWTQVERFPLVGNTGEWVNMIPNIEGHNPIIDTIDNIQVRTIEEILVNRSHSLYRDEIINWSKFIEYICRDMSLFQWSFVGFFNPSIKLIDINGYQTIYEDTNHTINDKHYSEQGNMDLFNDIIDLMNSSHAFYSQ